MFYAFLMTEDGTLHETAFAQSNDLDCLKEEIKLSLLEIDNEKICNWEKDSSWRGNNLNMYCLLESHNQSNHYFDDYICGVVIKEITS